MNIKLKNKITINALRRHYAAAGYRWETGLNLFGVRATDMTAGVFNDIIGIATDTELLMFAATVDPGSYYLNNPMHPKGTAVMKFQQTINGYVLGYHAGRYEALRQAKPMFFYRITAEQFAADGGREINLADKIVINGLIGANIHRANLNSVAEMVGSHSAGCQVIQRPDDWAKFLTRVKATKALRFSYALLGEHHLDRLGDLDPKTEKRV